MAATREHQPVLLDEVLAALNIRPDGVYVDGTFGRGGHAGAVLARLNEQGRLLAFDKDPAAVAAARERFAGDARFAIEHGAFTMLETVAQREGLTGRINGVLLDLGVSSPQLEDPARGFSFQSDGPLDMRMNTQAGESAADWLARADEREISAVIRDYGEERFHRRIARAILTARAAAPLRTTVQLAELVARAVPTRERGKHPATRTFQAIRIFINSELDELEAVLDQAVRVLATGGRLCVISFHSLEDRIVKRFMRNRARQDQGPPGLPFPVPGKTPDLKLVGKAVMPGDREVAANPRARSAVLRVAERLA